MEETILPRKALLEYLNDRAKISLFYQNRPYTFICVCTWYNEREYIGYGFSKCMYPDKWDAEIGADIAKKRALYMVLHEIRAHKRGQRRMAAFPDMTAVDMEEIRINELVSK
jgi:hypothetical protein